jgi:predicted RNase H-like nuclease (RuvC/YqgF family)
MQRRRHEEDEAGAATPGVAGEDGVSTGSGDDPASATDGDLAARVVSLEDRLERLESQLEGLQDSVHRETVRHERDIDALERKTEASEIARALGRHARDRGL